MSICLKIEVKQKVKVNYYFSVKTKMALAVHLQCSDVLIPLFYIKGLILRGKQVGVYKRELNIVAYWVAVC